MNEVRELTEALGGDPSPAQRQQIERAAMLSTVADDLAARALAGLSVCMDEVTRADGVARRARAAVLAMRPEPKPTERPGLRLARQRWAENAAARAAEPKKE